MRKELVDLIREAMDQHKLARDFYHRLAHRVAHADTKETFEYLARADLGHKEKLENIYDTVAFLEAW